MYRTLYQQTPDGRTVHVDLRDGGAVGVYVTDAAGATSFYLLPSRPVAQALAALLTELVGTPET